MTDPIDHRDRKLRQFFFDGISHPNCRNATQTGCKNGRAKGSCITCIVCPSCGGRLFFTIESTIIRHGTVSQTIIASCLHCGGYIIRGGRFVEIHKKAATKDGLPEKCSVYGCKHRTWSGLKITVAGQEYMVCDLDKRKHQRWIRGGSKEADAHLVQMPGDQLEWTMKRKADK